MLSVRCTISTIFFEWQVSDIKQFLLALIYTCVFFLFFFLLFFINKLLILGYKPQPECYL